MLYHTDALLPAFATGVGYTEMVKLTACPAHPFAVGVTLIVATVVELPVLWAVKALIFPVPVEGSPIDVLLFDHEYVVPLTPPVNTIIPVLWLLQTA